MKLTTKDLESLTHGVLSVKEREDGYTHFFCSSATPQACYRH